MKIDDNLTKFTPSNKRELSLMKTLEENEKNLELKESTLCKELKLLDVKLCFDGVFTKKKIKPHQPVCRYYGTLLDLDEVNKKVGKRVNMYDVVFCDKTMLDGSAFVPEFRKKWNTEQETWNFGPFLNDYRDNRNNCIITNNFWDPKRKKFFKVMMSTKTISAGKELCWSYGSGYWENFEQGRITGFK